MSFHKTCFAGVGAALLALGSNASAHIALREPTPRLAGDATNNELKIGPCGQASDGRTENVNVFAPGETITVTFDEFIPHPGYFRIAFDNDGDDDFPTRADADTVNTQTDNPNTTAFPVDGNLILAYLLEGGSGGSHTTQVTLPNVECENCTLQLIQFMYNAVGNGQVGDEYYYQCADLALRGDTGGAGGATSTSSTTTTATTTGVGGATATTATTAADSGTTGLAVGGTSSTTGVAGATSTTTGDASTTMVAASTTGAAGTSASVGGATAAASTGVTGVGGATSGAVGSTGVGGTFVDDVTQPPANQGCSCRMVGSPARGGFALASLALGLFWARRRRGR